MKKRFEVKFYEKIEAIKVEKKKAFLFSKIFIETNKKNLSEISSRNNLEKTLLNFSSQTKPVFLSPQRKFSYLILLKIFPNQFFHFTKKFSLPKNSHSRAKIFLLAIFLILSNPRNFLFFYFSSINLELR